MDNGESAKPRRIDWTREELILALDYYLDIRPSIGDDRNLRTIEIAALISTLPMHHVDPTRSTGRNATSVVFKLANFRAIDPTVDRKGFAGGAKGDQIVWDEFANDLTLLRQTANHIRAFLTAPDEASATLGTLADEIVEAEEGAVLIRVHRTRERNRKLIDEKKRSVLKKRGALVCEVCTFDFSQRYGLLGKDFIECHHTIPVSQLLPGETTKVKDLALVCSNCHRMLHRTAQVLSIDDLRKQLN